MKTKKRKLKLKLNNILIFLSFIGSIYFIYNILLLNNIENIFRFILIIIIIMIDLYFFRKNMLLKKNKNLFLLSMTIFISINFIFGSVINKVYSSIDSINKDKITYSSYLISMKKSSIENIDDCIDKKIGILNSVTNIDNYIIPMEIIKDNKLDEDNKIIKYEDLFVMLNDLYKGKIDLMFVSSNYNSMFSSTSGYENINSDIKIITSNTKKINKKEIEEKNSGKSLTKPFTILLMGVDSEKDGLDKAASNGDSLMLFSFNPTTLNATMLSIPRDSYVPITCFKSKRETKLTHAGWYGSKCMIGSIENFLDIEIDYYIKINFKGVVSLVDALDGVNVDVPRDLCTNSSNRTGKVCIKKGNQNLDGEGALVLARNRYDMPMGDFDRSKNQQLLLKAILNKMKTVRSVKTFNNILNTISRNMDTNLNTSQILSFYNIFKDIVKVNRVNKDVVNIERLYLSGTGQSIYDETTKLTLWNYVLNKNSIKEVNKAMKDNLNLDAKLTKNFEYLVEDGYTKYVPGSKVTGNTTYDLLPNFVGQNKYKVDEFTKNKKVKVKYIYKLDNKNKFDSNTVIKQNYRPKTRLDKIDVLEITLLKKDQKYIEKEKIDCSNNFKDVCLLPSFIGKTKEDILTYFNKYKNLDEVKFNYVDKDLYPKNKPGTAISQNYKVNTHLKKVKNLEISIIKK